MDEFTGDYPTHREVVDALHALTSAIDGVVTLAGETTINAGAAGRIIQAYARARLVLSRAGVEAVSNPVRRA